MSLQQQNINRFHKIQLKMEALKKAIEWFAEKPSERMDTYPCHNGITTKEKCGRCSRAIAAWKALHMEE